MTALIQTEELNQHRVDPNWMLFDCRFYLDDESRGERDYREGHIPGAIYAHLNRDLSDTPIVGKTGRHPLPERESFLATLSRWGLRPEMQVVVYDQGPGAFASRLWWMLRWMGHAKVSLLNGGYAAWVADNLPVTKELPELSPIDYPPQQPLTRETGAHQLPDDQLLLLDARTRERFEGKVEPIDPVAGHIPGAVCRPFQENLHPDQTFRSGDVLREDFERLGAGKRTDIVCYCGSGVTATHNIFALHLAGYDEPALYPGSWSEWITDPRRPRVP